MYKKKQNSIDIGRLRVFFQFRLNIWIVVSSTIILISIYLYFLSLRDLRIFPGTNDFTIEFYTDSANGGNSKILSHNISDTAIDLDFDLNGGFSSPYIGLCIRSRTDSVINLSHYNQFHLDIEGQKVNSIWVSLYNRNPYHKYATNSKELGFYANLEISPERKQYDINLNQLKVPDWWREVNNISSNEKIKPDFKNVLNINIGTAYTPIHGAKHSLHIYSISLQRNNEKHPTILV